MKGISILGSTGSIGSQTLDVISSFPEDYRVIGLAAGKNVSRLREQILKFKPKIVSLRDTGDARELRESLGNSQTVVLAGDRGANAVATDTETELVVSAMVGAVGLEPTFNAIRAGKDVALANKEVMVMAGSIITSEATRMGVRIIPVDSEHSALLQTLRCGPSESVKRVILTASGGPFRNLRKSEIPHVTVEEALQHPTWNMGDKITIDSATLMNKGFEIIEARWFFGLSPEQISVWIHPQSIVHSLVEYVDGSFIAQMSLPDMKIPIAYALSCPARAELNGTQINPWDFTNLTFEEPDLDRFPALGLAYRALERGGTMPAVMNAANEVAVDAFMKAQIKFNQLSELIERVMEHHTATLGEELEEIFECDSWARDKAKSIIEEEMQN